MVSTPSDAERFGAYSRAAARGQAGRPERIWWHFATGDGDMYVSLSPGEYRNTRPDDGAPILEGPKPDDARPMTRTLAKWLESADIDDDLAQRARHVLRLRDPAAVDEEVEAFRREYRELVASGIDVPEIEQKLFQWYWTRRLPGFPFNCEYAYLALAHRTGVHIQTADGSTADPASMLNTFITATSDEHPQILDEAANLANVQFQWGRERMREAIESTTLRRFYDKLFFAAHHFMICTLVSRLLETRGAIAKLDFQPFVAEEGWAGLQAGIVWNVTEEPVDYEQLFLDHVKDGDLAEARRYADFLSSATNPIYPRPVVKLWLARAMARAGGEHAAKALPMLQELEASFNAGDSAEPEFFQFMTGLIAAYNAAGDEESARRTATRLAGVMLARRLLGGG